MRKLLLLSVIACVAATPLSAQFLRPAKEVRTINTDVYEISVQKNGRTDINLTTRETVFENAYPMVQLAGEESPRPLKVDGRYSVRTEINDRLGKGHGLLLVRDNCEWRLQAYPTKPFFTVSLTYINTGRKAVHVEKLLPWCVGDPKPGAFRMGAPAADTILLGNNLEGQEPYPRTGAGISEGNITAISRSGGRSLIAGFLTQAKARTQIELDQGTEAPHDGFGRFRASCVYDPPVELQPGERLEAELLYVAIGETDPLLGLERYAKATAVTNGVRDVRPLTPHGWHGGMDASDEISEQQLLDELNHVAEELAPYGWRHFTIGAGWARHEGDWQPDADRFASGMATMTKAIHDRGMTAGLALSPFTAARDSHIARQHPEWLLSSASADALQVLDVTQPEVYAHISALAHKIRNEWHFDAIEIDASAERLYSAQGFAEQGRTRVEVVHLGMQALREGFGKDGFISSAAPAVVTGLYAEAVQPGQAHAGAHANGQAVQTGAAEALSTAIRQFYRAPHLYLLDPGAAYFGQQGNTRDLPQALTRAQSLVWFSGAALTAGPVRFGEAPSSLGPEQLAILRKLLPVANTPARPVDLFRNAHPQIWSLPLETEAGAWHILGLFNWDTAAPETLTIHVHELQLDARNYHTVFDFWSERFYGLTQETLQIEVPPASVRIIGLRPFEGRPMLIAHDRHFAQGALEYQALEWDDQENTLAGSFEAIANTEYTVWLYMPEGYQLQGVSLGDESLETTLDDAVVQFAIKSVQGGLMNWHAAFTPPAVSAR